MYSTPTTATYYNYLAQWLILSLQFIEHRRLELTSIVLISHLKHGLSGGQVSVLLEGGPCQPVLKISCLNRPID